ncbi:hypothetical protein U9M48_002289 [Paspalum notatum var. saurae]|uniref:RWD domain-containing protein n=1 Tax=Paspalum notatum var. saurae TaxID=547442 RepID=A0AAQ3PQL3_PASNO
MAAEAEEELRLELEAVAAVYGDDVRVLRDIPPHLVVHVRPRTADDSSQQVRLRRTLALFLACSGPPIDECRESWMGGSRDWWAHSAGSPARCPAREYCLFVELFLGIKASSQYPMEPPHIYAVESKGLDESRQAYLIASIQNKAKELSNYPMLVTLCEEAGEILSNMNHPEGDCPLCLYPLMGEDKAGELPFMKLMSCYHCFHSDCIMRWWEWLQHGDANPKESNTGGADIISCLSVFSLAEILNTFHRSDKHYNVNQHQGFCPVCRKVFDEKDIEHVRGLLGENTSCLASLTVDLGKDEKELLNSEAEQNRRKRIESVVNLQQERNGLIEPKKDLAIQPGMYVSLPPSTPDTTEEVNSAPSEDTTTSTSETVQCDLANNANSNKPKHSGHRRRNRGNVSRRQHHGQPGRQQWQRKEADTSHQ